MNDKVVIAGDGALKTTLDGEIRGQAEIIDGQPFPIYQRLINEHERLIHRDWPDQHPISAVSQLLQELSARPAESMSNTDIQNILNR